LTFIDCEQQSRDSRMRAVDQDSAGTARQLWRGGQISGGLIQASRAGDKPDALA
jgi:hypothetical protein